MKVCAIIAEYNPFHNGHMYHINKSKEMSSADGIIVIMSGNFVQRGGPALIDKWKRSKSAVLNGADLVIELPYVYASQTAEIFAKGAVQILDSTNAIDYLSFGSESENLSELKKIAEILSEEPEEYSELLKNGLKKGLNYPAARELAVEKYLGTEIPELSEPNNILGIEYLKALYELNSSIEPVNIVRYKSSHNSPKLISDISSATSIRKILLENMSPDRGINELLNTVPDSTSSELIAFLDEHGCFNSFDKLFRFILYQLIFDSMESDSLKKMNIFDLDNDLFNRIINSINKNYGKINNIEELMEKIKSKNYTLTRIRRVLSNIAMKLKSEDVYLFKNHRPNYVRVLASNKKGFDIISKIKKNSDLNIILKFSDIKTMENSTDRKMLEYEVLSTNLYNLLLDNTSINQDYRTTPFIQK